MGNGKRLPRRTPSERRPFRTAGKTGRQGNKQNITALAQPCLVYLGPLPSKSFAAGSLVLYLGRAVALGCDRKGSFLLCENRPFRRMRR